jgi:hypothetical protein
MFGRPVALGIWPHRVRFLLSKCLFPSCSLVLLVLTAGISRRTFSPAGNHFDASVALELLSVVLGVLGVCSTLSLDLVFELLQWHFTARAGGSRPIELLTVAPTTSLLGALKICFWSDLVQPPITALRKRLKRRFKRRNSTSSSSLQTNLPSKRISKVDGLWAASR